MISTQIRSQTRISVKGRKLYKFINALHSGDICCSGQFCRKDTFYCEIPTSRLEDARKLAEEFELEFSYAHKDSLFGRLKRYRLRFGLIIGIVAVIAASLYFSSVVVTIDIQGNSRVSDQEILSALDELGIRRGTHLKDIDFHIVGNQLRVMLGDISWAALRHTGNRVVVEVTEITEKPEMFSSRTPCNIFAAHDAEITYTSVLDGQLMHIVGDHVPEGTLLVSGVTGDLTGHVVLHHAMGEIRGIYEEELTFTEDFSVTEYVPTGETKKESRLRLFDLDIPLFLGRNKFESCETESTESSLCLFGKELPIGIKRSELTETELSETVRTEDELRDILMEKVYLYEKNFLSDNTVILDRDITESSDGNSMSFAVHYRIEGDIGVQREIIAK